MKQLLFLWQWIFGRLKIMGITCSFLDKKFELREATLACVRYPYTSEHILDALKDVLTRQKIRDLIFTITTNNKSNVKKAILDMGKVNWLGCTANTLHLVIERAVKPAEILIARVKRYVDCLKQNEFLEEEEENIVSISKYFLKFFFKNVY